MRSVLRAGSLARGSVTIGIGVAVGQGLVLAAAPVISRLYAPEDFGAFALFTSVFSVAVVGSAAAFDQAVPIAGEDDEAWGLVLIGLVASVVMAVLLGLGSWGVGAIAPESAWAALPIMTPVLLGVGVLCAGCQRSLVAWAVRGETHGDLAKVRVIQGASQAGLQISGGVLSSGPIGLMLGDALGRGVGGFHLITGWWRSRPMEPRALRPLARTYIRYPLIVGGSGLVNALGLYLPLSCLVALYGKELAGQFMLAFLVMAAPVALVGTAVGQVFYGRLASIARNDPDQVIPLFVSAARRLFAVAVVVSAVLTIPAPWIFPLVFGDEWVTAGNLAKILGPLYLMQLTVSPLSQSIYVANRLRLQFAWDMMRVVMVGVVFGMAWWQEWTAPVAIAGYAWLMAILYLVLGLLYRYCLREFLQEGV